MRPNLSRAPSDFPNTVRKATCPYSPIDSQHYYSSADLVKLNDPVIVVNSSMK